MQLGFLTGWGFLCQLKQNPMKKETQKIKYWYSSSLPAQNNTVMSTQK